MDNNYLDPIRRPKFLHDNREDAEKEALRLEKIHGRDGGSFVVFESVLHSDTRTPFEVAATPVQVLAPMTIQVANVTINPKRKRRAA